MSDHIVKAALVVFWSAIKYLLGFFMALGMGFSFVETLIYNVGGGMLGVVVYLYLWDFMTKLRRRFFPPKPRRGIRISNTRRFMVKLIRRHKLLGIVILTPLLLTPPVGTIIAVTVEHDKWKIKRMMFFSFLGWTLGLYGIYAFFGIRLDEVIRDLF